LIEFFSSLSISIFCCFSVFYSLFLIFYSKLSVNFKNKNQTCSYLYSKHIINEINISKKSFIIFKIELFFCINNIAYYLIIDGEKRKKHLRKEKISIFYFKICFFFLLSNLKQKEYKNQKKNTNFILCFSNACVVFYQLNDLQK
jgi:hypothetical protein